MPDYRCLTEAADYRKKCRCQTNFYPTFTYLFSISYSMDVHGVSLFTASSKDVQGVSLSTASSMYVQCVPFFKCRTVWHPVSPVTERTEMPMPEPVRYRNKGTQSGTGLRSRMLEYRCWPHRPRCRCQLCITISLFPL
jgi:hypothetical protein